MTHPAFSPDAVAAVTGGATGIGLAAAKQFAGFGMKIAIADTQTDLFDAAEATLRAAGAGDVLMVQTDVCDIAQVEAFERQVTDRFGGTDILMNNAGIQPGSSLFGPEADWQRILGVNLGGVLNGTRVFGPPMIERGRPGAIINTGSKQGITTPPGDPAYNVTKAGVKAFSEALAHELRNTQGAQITAHLMIPGFVFTELNRRGRSEKPDDAWTPDQAAAFMIDAMNKGDFYILCPDNDVDRATDEKRMAWAIGDIIENRPPLSRWHPDWGDKFQDYLNA